MENVSTGGKEPVVKTARAVTEIELYVYLDGSVTEEQLKRVFDPVCDVESVKICVDPATGEPLGYGHVYLRNPQDAEKAMQALNLSFLNGKQIRNFCSNRGGNPGILFFKHLYKGLSKKAVENLSHAHLY